MNEQKSGADGRTKADLLAELVAAGEVEVGSHDHRRDWPAEARAAVRLSVRINDCFMWGCADSETLTADGIETLHALWTRDAMWGGLAWAMIQRREMPQEPMERMMRDEGGIDVDALRDEHGLRPNQYDGVMGVIAERKYALYAEWRRKAGGEPTPYDEKWWSGWEEFKTANPEWETAEWDAAESTAIDAWYEANGHDPRAEPAAEPLDELRRAIALADAAADTRAKLGEGMADPHGAHLAQIAHDERRAARALGRVEAALAAATGA